MEGITAQYLLLLTFPRLKKCVSDAKPSYKKMNVILDFNIEIIVV